MFETAISTDGASPAATTEALEPVHAMLAALAEFAGAAPAGRAAQNDGFAPSLAARYAAAGTIAQRRCDAILREAETIGTTGLRLIAGRSGKADAATIAAARFLGNSLDAALRRLDRTLPALAA